MKQGEDRRRCFRVTRLSVSEGDQTWCCCGASEDEGWFNPANHADGASICPARSEVSDGA